MTWCRVAPASLVVLLALTAGCARPPATPPSAATATGDAVFKPVPKELPEVVARVNGEAIGGPELERAVRNLEAQAGQPVPPERRDEVYRKVLDELVAFRLLKQATEQRGMSVSDADVDAELARLRAQFSNEVEFLQALAGRGVSLELLKAETRAGLLVSKLLEQELGPKVSVSEKDVEAFYAKNPSQFVQPEAVRASHILIRVDPKADRAARQKARERADAVLRLARNGADFAALAREHSADTGSAAKGGDLGYFPRGQMVPAFEQAAFALKPGEVSGLVETDFGLHIIKLTDRRPSRTVPLDEARARITAFLVDQQRQQLTDAFVAGLRSKARVEILI